METHTNQYKDWLLTESKGHRTRQLNINNKHRVQILFFVKS